MPNKPKSQAKTNQRKYQIAMNRFEKNIQILEEKIEAKAPKEETEYAKSLVEKSFESLEEAVEEYSLILADSDYEDLKISVNDHSDKLQAVMSLYFAYMREVTSQSLGPESGTVHQLQLPTPPPKLQSKAPLPQFDGSDITQYPMFKREMQRILEKYEESDRVYTLKTCLQDRAKPWVMDCKDLNQSWSLLDDIYGDPRLISDALIGKIIRMKPLTEYDDRLGELYHLIKRTHLILSELEMPGDLDNSTTIGHIERKLPMSDRIEWAKSQKKDKIKPTIANFMEWIQSQLWIRNVAGADIRSNRYAKGVVHMSTELDYQNYSQKGEIRDTDYFSTENSTDESAAVMELTSGQFSGQSTSSQQYRVNENNENCWLCDESGHLGPNCPKIKELAPSERLKLVSERSKSGKHVCIFCMRAHRGFCRRRKRCSEKNDGDSCKYYHHPLLHGADFELLKGSMNSLTSDSACSTILPVITVTCSNPHTDAIYDANVLIDSGSQLSVISESLACKLCLQGRNVSLTIGKVGGDEEIVNSTLYKIHIKSNDNHVKYAVNVVSLPKISDSTTVIDMKTCAESFGVDIKKLRRDPGEIDLILGINNPRFHDGEMMVNGSLALKHTVLGPVIFGDLPKSQNSGHSCAAQGYHTCNLATSTKLSDKPDMSSFWEGDQMGVSLNPCCVRKSSNSKNLSPIDQREDTVIRESAKLCGDRWMIPLPIQGDLKGLPSNYNEAYTRLESTERRLRKNPSLAQSYQQQIDDMVNRGCIRKLSTEEIAQYPGPVHYLSHHVILRPDKPSTPCRLVISPLLLNEFLLKGPDLLNSIISVLIKWREQRYAVIGDISKMFNQVWVDPVRDANIQRILWRDMKTKRPDVYVCLVVMFGIKPAPALANTALDLTAENNKSLFPDACRVIKDSRYMDDICDSRRTVEEIQSVTGEIDKVLSKGHFKIKEWLSNINVFPSESSPDTKCQIESESTGKVLGLMWDRSSDDISVAIKKPKQFTSAEGSDGNGWVIPPAFTLRLILGVLNSIYDVFGILAAFTVRAKVAMQKLWKENYGWDDPISQFHYNFWYKWFRELEQASSLVKIPRCMTPDDSVGPPSLCVFADASIHAFGAIAFCRYEVTDGTFVCRFITAKSKVAPLKSKLEIPKLELNAAVLAARLVNTILSESRLKFEVIYIFIDSMIVLSWIQNGRRAYLPFVSCRVNELLMITDPGDWLYCCTELNVADDITRGLKIHEIVDSRYVKAPVFLSSPRSHWPVMIGRETVTDTIVINKEVRKERVLIVMDQAKDSPLEGMGKFSSLTRAVRMTATLLRAVNNFKSLSPTYSGRDVLVKLIQTPLSVDETEKAEQTLVKHAQRFLPKNYETLPEYRNLSLFVEDQVVKVGGRVDKSEVSYSRKHPDLLPHSHWLSKLLVLHVHNFGHTGVAATAAKVRAKYWIMGVERIAKSVKYKCVFCRELDSKTERPMMADLPSDRIVPTPPFLNTCLDLFGPLTLKVSRNKTTKSYGVIFTCMTTRAVYIDLADSYSTSSFLLVLRRFMDIRGQPNVIHCDNGSQLIGADHELKKVVQGWDHKTLQEFCHSRKTTWKFTTPKQPAVCAEALIKTTKRTLRLSVADRSLYFNEMQTVLFEAANLVNSRPIGRIPNDPNDGKFISPNDLLLGRSSSEIPQGPFSETNDPRVRFNFVQSIVTSWWKKWYRDVFPLLFVRRKWNVKCREIRVGDFVLVKEPNPIRGHYTKGRVIQVFPGTDGKIRNVSVRTTQGDHQRPVCKLVVILPVEGWGDA